MRVNIKLDKRRITKEGNYPIVLYFSNKGEQATYSLGIYAKEHEFDPINQLLLLDNPKTKNEFSRLNIRLSAELSKAKALLLSLELNGKANIKPVRFKELLLKQADAINLASSFSDYFKECIGEMARRTGEIYHSTLVKIEKYYPGGVEFDDITISWLEGFDRKMKAEKYKQGNAIKVGLAANTRSMHFRNIRAIYNKAIDEELIGLNAYPFRKFKIVGEETEHRAISVEDLRRVFNYEGTDSENWARDVSKLIFFLIGINAIDLFSLSGISGGRIKYRRSKTNRLYSIKLEPEIKVLLEKFKGEASFLVFSEQFKDEKSLLKKINGITIYKDGEKKFYKKGLNSIGESLGIPGLTTYVLRHSWATIAASLEIPKETISAALGHGKKTVTDVYIDFDLKKVDEANRRVLDHVLGVEGLIN